MKVAWQVILMSSSLFICKSVSNGKAIFLLLLLTSVVIVILTACKKEEQLSSQPVQPQPTQQNKQPVVNTGPDQVVTLPPTVSNSLEQEQIKRGAL
jgi:hypothetical protein